ncbi:hypothetical protein PPYR_15674, partial [Photinus pyralis]
VFIVKYNLIIVTVYRSPNGNFDVFRDRLTNLLSFPDIWNKNVVITGDFNFKFNSPDKNCLYICDLLQSFGFTKLVSAPTRKANTLDNVFTNMTDVNKISTVDTNLSDHLGISFNLYPNTRYRDVIVKKIYRPITEYGKVMLCNVVSEESWRFVSDKSIDSSTKFQMFINKISDYVNSSFQEKKYTGKASKVHYVRWFTPQLEKMRETVAFLSDACKQNPTVFTTLQLRKYKAMYKTELHKSKTNAFDKYISNSKSKSKTMWNLINQNRKKSLSPKCPIEPNSLNIYFTSVAENIIHKLPNTNINPIKLMAGIDVPIAVSFSFKEVSYSDVRIIIDNMKTNKSKDCYGLSFEIIKTIKNYIIIPLTKIINSCIKE